MWCSALRAQDEQKETRARFGGRPIRGRASSGPPVRLLSLHRRGLGGARRSRPEFSQRPRHKRKGVTSMKTLASTFALALALAFTGPAVRASARRKHPY